ncbi:MAG: NAD-dependent protein deacylase [Bacilli bacterium]|nr:NAD-dependent protein deacylase [Bacilli bacterium]MDD4388908.1 NAD-dependent protein deacylase [Bacilli bacterium]
MKKIEQLKAIIDRSNNIVFFGGAGVSVPSGIPDFRGSDGLEKQKIPFEIILSHDYFLDNPDVFYPLYREKLIFPDAKPNAAHDALVKLEKTGKLKAVITQNIDNLHQKAGSSKVIELHGSVYRNYCINCNKKYKIDVILKAQDVPHCECGGIIRPDIVFYQESLDSQVLSEAIFYLSKADTLIVSGTSLVVYPAAGLIRYFTGDNLVIINKSRTDYDRHADLVIYDSVDEVLSAAVE